MPMMITMMKHTDKELPNDTKHKIQKQNKLSIAEALKTTNSPQLHISKCSRLLLKKENREDLLLVH